MVLFPSNINIKNEEYKIYQFRTYRSMRILCFIVQLDEFGVVKVDKVAFSLVYDEVIGTEISMKNLLLRHHHFVGYWYLSASNFLVNTRRTHQQQGQEKH
jgi:hypothetical protein